MVKGKTGRAGRPPPPTRQEVEAARGKTVADVIAPGLKVLFCGINPGLYTAAVGHHFARPGNRFWPSLYAGGFTPRLLYPEQERELLSWGWGITNLVERATTAAAELTPDELARGGQRLRQRVLEYRPNCLAVLGVGAYRQAFERKEAALGLQPEQIGETLVWVLPNPSGLNAHYRAADFGRLFGELREYVEALPQERFSSRVGNYVQYRPGYPPEILEPLRRECGLTPDWRVADIGSGTGMLTRLFLENGNRVDAVEPNKAMRRAAEESLNEYRGFQSVAGAAEHTGLPQSSVDLIAAGQAFHWFSLGPARSEFQRILKPGGWVALVWNVRRLEGSPAFMQAYEQLMVELGTDYQVKTMRLVDADAIRRFFGGPVELRHFENFQELDWPGLEGRALSASYAPLPDHPNFPRFVEQLRQVFDRYQADGLVRIEYDTQLYFGRLTA